MFIVAYLVERASARTQEGLSKGLSLIGTSVTRAVVNEVYHLSTYPPTHPPDRTKNYGI